ncbi:MAG: WD40 repeat domain-containing protein [Cyclobacteriaceae bacterium]
MSSPMTVEKVHTYTGHKDCLYVMQIIDESRLVSAGADGMIILWDLKKLTEGRMIAQVPTSVYALAYDSQKDELVIGQNFDGISVIGVDDKVEKHSLSFTKSAIFDIKLDEKYVFAACGNGELVVIDRAKWQIEKRVQLSEKSARTIALNEQHIAVGYSDNYIRIFERESFNCVHEFRAHDISVFTLQFDPTGRYLVSGSRDAQIKIWEVQNYELVNAISAHMYAINHLTFSPDHRHFVSCSMDKSIKIWDSSSFKLQKVIDKARHAGHGTSVNKLAWLSFKNYLVSCSDDRTISVWDINFDNQ